MIKKVIFVMYDDVQLLDVSGPAGVLSMVNSLLGEEYYDMYYVSASQSGSVLASNRMSINTDPLPDAEQVDMLIVPGALEEGVTNALQDATLMNWLASMNTKAEEKICICMGTFFFAELNWLIEKRATTHWAAIEQLKAQYPDIRVMNDTLYQNDGDIWSSGGVMAGVDMMLAIVARDLGIEIALKVAKLLVVHLFRDGGQSQYSSPVEFQSMSKDQNIVSLIAWLQTRLDKPTSVKEMAEYAAMSVRKLHVQCQDFFGHGPAQLLTEMRMENARALLRNERASIQEVASSCGYSQSTAFSRAFTRRYGTSPSRYRQSFRTPV